MTREALVGLRVIITRPRAQATAWQSRLQQAGASCLALPLLSIEPVQGAAEIQAVKNIVLDIDHYAIAIFVSQNAVTFGCDWLDRYWPELPLGLAMLAVGKATASKLRDLGHSVTAAGQAMNSEALLELPQLQQVAGKKIVVFRGCGGRPLLGETLKARGASVDYCELYHRRLPQGSARALAALVLGAGDVISVHSGETLTNLTQSLGAERAAWIRQPILVPGQRVAQLAKEAGFERVIVAENATDEAMLAALLQWRESA